MALQSALTLLKWGVESRVWLPHSMTSQLCVKHRTLHFTSRNVLTSSNRNALRVSTAFSERIFLFHSAAPPADPSSVSVQSRRVSILLARTAVAYANHAISRSIPLALHLLYVCSSLFPAEVDWQRLRHLLHRLQNQCEQCIAGNFGMSSELRRAEATKQLALKLDRFAFEQIGYDDAPPAPKVEEGLFGDEVSRDLRSASQGGCHSNALSAAARQINKSLAALGYENSFWGGVLVGALED